MHEIERLCNLQCNKCISICPYVPPCSKIESDCDRAFTRATSMEVRGGIEKLQMSVVATNAAGIGICVQSEGIGASVLSALLIPLSLCSVISSV